MSSYLQGEFDIQIHLHKLKEIKPNNNTKCGKVRSEVIKYWENRLQEIKSLKTKE